MGMSIPTVLQFQPRTESLNRQFPLLQLPTSLNETYLFLTFNLYVACQCSCFINDK